MSASSPIPYEAALTDVLMHLGATHEKMPAEGLPKTLSHLIELRVSQMNGCGYCVKLHTAEARKDGETNDRLDRLIVWRNVSDFTDAEKAAFAWAEALTDISQDTDYGALRAELRKHYDDKMISLITTCIGMINLWNRVRVSNY